jgi:hypothetical protein
LLVRRPKSIRCWACGAELDEEFRVTKPGDPQAEAAARAARAEARAKRAAARAKSPAKRATRSRAKKTAAKKTAAKKTAAKKKAAATRAANAAHREAPAPAEAAVPEA